MPGTPLRSAAEIRRRGERLRCRQRAELIVALALAVIVVAAVVASGLLAGRG